MLPILDATHALLNSTKPLVVIRDAFLFRLTSSIDQSSLFPINAYVLGTQICRLS